MRKEETVKVAEKMVLFALLAALAAGCGAKHAQRHAVMMTMARAEIVKGKHEKALKLLARADKFRIAKRLPYSTDGALLHAEAKMRAGDYVSAARAVRAVLVRKPGDPRAHEVAGKIRLKTGDFGSADRHFGLAKAGFGEERDKSRVQDLLALSRGLDRYEHGDIAGARLLFREITSKALRESLSRAMNQVAGTGGGSNGHQAE